MERSAQGERPTRPEEVSAQATREYEVMVRAVEALERALAAPAPGREPAWKQGVRRGLATVVGLMQEHCGWAEGASGLLTEVELRLGRASEVSEARREHERLRHDATGLLAALDAYQEEPSLSSDEVRRRAGEITAALRRHQAREVDLLMLAFQRDIGTVD